MQAIAALHVDRAAAVELAAFDGGRRRADGANAPDRPAAPRRCGRRTRGRGGPAPRRAKRFSTSGVPGSEKTGRSTAKPASVRTSAMRGERPALRRRNGRAADQERLSEGERRLRAHVRRLGLADPEEDRKLDRGRQRFGPGVPRRQPSSTNVDATDMARRTSIRSSSPGRTTLDGKGDPRRDRTDDANRRDEEVRWRQDRPASSRLLAPGARIEIRPDQVALLRQVGRHSTASARRPDPDRTPRASPPGSTPSGARRGCSAVGPTGSRPRRGAPRPRRGSVLESGGESRVARQAHREAAPHRPTITHCVIPAFTPPI